MARSRISGLIAPGLIAVALLPGCVLLLPRWLYPSLSAAELKGAKLAGKQRIEAARERLTLQNGARTALLHGLGGAVVLPGACFTYRQLRISREQLLPAVEANRQQPRAPRDGQVTGRFTRAAGQPGSKPKHVQPGGIYPRQQTGRSSPGERSAS